MRLDRQRACLSGTTEASERSGGAPEVTDFVGPTGPSCRPCHDTMITSSLVADANVATWLEQQQGRSAEHAYRLDVTLSARFVAVVVWYSVGLIGL